MMFSRAWIYGLTILGVAGCAGVPPLPDDQFYRLVATREFTSLPTATISDVLVVEMPRAAGVRQGRPILYSRPPHVRFQQYHYHLWEETPPRLLRDRLVSALRASGVAGTVVTRGVVGDAVRVATDIRRFERQLDPGGPRVIVEIAVTVRSDSAGVAPLLVGTYRESRPAASGGMEDTAVAFAEAVDATIAALIRDLGAL